MMRAATMETIAPAGMRMPTGSVGMATKRHIINTSGATEIFQFLDMKTTPKAPNSEGSRLANAGLSVGDSSTGKRKHRQQDCDGWDDGKYRASSESPPHGS
jgi:hypothetical protein